MRIDEQAGVGDSAVAVPHARWSPTTAVLRLVRFGLLLLIPVSLLGGGTSTGGRLVAVAAVGALALVAVVLAAGGVLRLRRPHLWIALLAGMLAVSFAFPVVRLPMTLPPEKHRVVDFVGILGGLTPTQLTRLTDFVGMLAGLTLLAISVAAAPQAQHLTRLIAVSGAVAALYVLFTGNYTDSRLEGLSCNANYLGGLLALPLVASVGMIRYARNARWIAPAAVCFVAIADTQSRGAFAAAAVGVAVVLIQGRSLRWQAVMVVTLGVLAAAAIGGNLHTIGSLGTSDRSAASMSANNGLRLKVAGLAVRVAIEHPLRGVGYWMFPTYAVRSPGFGIYLATHNDYLRLAAEAGIPAMAAVLVLIWLGIRYRRSGDLAVLRAVVITYAVGLLFANPMAILVISAPFWLALGCLLAHARTATPRTAPSHDPPRHDPPAARPAKGRPATTNRSSSTFMVQSDQLITYIS